VLALLWRSRSPNRFPSGHLVELPATSGTPHDMRSQAQDFPRLYSIATMWAKLREVELELTFETGSHHPRLSRAYWSGVSRKYRPPRPSTQSPLLS
jgi:hypothetical protein